MERGAVRVAGVGFRAGAAPADLVAALDGAGPVAALATVAEKAAALEGLAAGLGLPVLAVAVAGVETPSVSARVVGRFGTGSLAEAAALKGVEALGGRGAKLVMARRVVAGRLTLAVAGAGAEGEAQ